VLLEKRTSSIPDLARDDVVAMFQKICSEDCSEAERDFALAQLEYNLDDPKISDLIYWPGEYFGDGDNAREMTAEEMAEAVLARKRERDAQLRSTDKPAK